MADTGPATIDQYIDSFPAEVKAKLSEIRAVIHQAAPDALERISYRMPTYFLGENLVHFAAASGHIGFYPTPSGVEHFAPQLGRYHTSKGTIQFPMEEPLPVDLIREITLFRVAEVTAKFGDKLTSRRPTR